MDLFYSNSIFYFTFTVSDAKNQNQWHSVIIGTRFLCTAVKFKNSFFLLSRNGYTNVILLLLFCHYFFSIVRHIQFYYFYYNFFEILCRYNIQHCVNQNKKAYYSIIWIKQSRTNLKYSFIFSNYALNKLYLTYQEPYSVIYLLSTNFPNT